MQLICGGYTFPDNEIGLRVFKQRQYSPRGGRLIQRVTMDIVGTRLADDSALLTAALAALESGLQEGADLTLYDNNGSPTVHSMSSSGSLAGVKIITPVEYPGGNPGVWGMGTEYVNKRTYRVRFQADYLDADSNIIFYQQSLTRIGTGGPRTVWCQSLTGVPIPQTVRQFTTYLLIQQGSCVGLTSYLGVDAPLFGDPYLKHERVRITDSSPQKIYPNASLYWPQSWTYVFESAGVL